MSRRLQICVSGASEVDAQLAEFVDSIRVGRAPSADGLVGLCNMRIVDAAYQSAESGKVVVLS